MRIGMVCPYSFDEPGGVQAHILDLAEYFLKQGHYVRVLGPCSDDTEVPDFVVRGGPSIPIPYNGSVARLSMGPHVPRILKDFITEGRFDVVHVHEPNSPSYSMATLWQCTGPIVATYHASSEKSTLLKLALPGLRHLLEKVHGGIAVSELARRWQVEQLGGDPVLIPNGVDTQRFITAATPRHTRGRSAVFMGRLDESRKGLQVLLDAWPAVLEAVPDAQLTVIGAGTRIPAPAVTYVGRVSDEEKAKILGSSSLYVAPNLGGESFGIVLVEAMAAGCTVLASDLEAFSDVAQATHRHPAAQLFPTGSSEALAENIVELLTDTDRADRLAARGSARAADFDWDTVARRVMEVYETVAAADTGPVRAAHTSRRTWWRDPKDTD